MNNASVFSLGKVHSDHLTIRQNISAQNVANLSVPGYKALKVSDFGSYLSAQRSTGQTGSIDSNSYKNYTATLGSSRNGSERPESLSGSNLTLEHEMADAGSIRREFNINTTLLKSFHKMYLTSLKI